MPFLGYFSKQKIGFWVSVFVRSQAAINLRVSFRGVTLCLSIKSDVIFIHLVRIRNFGQNFALYILSGP